MSRKDEPVDILGSGTHQRPIPGTLPADGWSGGRTLLGPAPTATGSDVYDTLLAVLDQVAEPPPDDLPAALAALPEEPALPPLSETWQLLRLIPQYQQYDWVVRHVFNPLIRDVHDVRRSLMFQLPLQGRSPHQPDWYFRLEYNDTPVRWSAIHRHTHDWVDVVPPLISLMHCHDGKDLHHLPVWADDPLRLGDVAPDLAAYRWMVEELCDEYRHKVHRSLEPDTFRQVMQTFVRELLHRRHAVATFHAHWKEPVHRVWLAALLGDWLPAHAAALTRGDPAVITLTGLRAKRWLRGHGYLLRDNEYFLENETVEALLRQDHQAFVQGVRSLVVGGWRQPLWVALEKDLPGLEVEAAELFKRFESPQGQPWQAVGGYYLLRRGIRTREVIRALAKRIRQSREQVGNDNLYDALLVAHHDAKLGRDLLSRALHAPTEVLRVRAITALAALEQPWADELVAKALAHERSEIACACCRLAIDSRQAQGRGLRPGETVSAMPAVTNGKQRLRVRRQPDAEFPPKPAGNMNPDDFLDDLPDQGEELYVRYYGTVQELFEDQVEKARRWLHDWQVAGDWLY